MLYSLFVLNLLTAPATAQPGQDRRRHIDHCVDNLLEVTLPDVADQRLTLLLATPEGQDLRRQMEDAVSRIFKKADALRPRSVDLVERGEQILTARRDQWIPDFLAKLSAISDQEAPSSIALEAFGPADQNILLPEIPHRAVGGVVVPLGGRLALDSTTYFEFRPSLVDTPSTADSFTSLALSEEGQFLLEGHPLRLAFTRQRSLYSFGPATGNFVAIVPAGREGEVRGIAVVDWEFEGSKNVGEHSLPLGHWSSRFQVHFNRALKVLRISQTFFKITAINPALRVDVSQRRWLQDGKVVSTGLSPSTISPSSHDRFKNPDLNLNWILGDEYRIEPEGRIEYDFDVNLIKQF